MVAQRITVTIPNGLHERLQLVKKDMNVSEVCQLAIEQVVELEEIRVRKDLSPKERTILRLRKEREIACGQWKAQGIENGIADACFTLSWASIQSIATTGSLSNQEDKLDLKGKWHSFAPQSWLALQSYDDAGYRAYEQGWIKGVTCTWQALAKSE